MKIFWYSFFCTVNNYLPNLAAFSMFWKEFRKIWQSFFKDLEYFAEFAWSWSNFLKTWKILANLKNYFFPSIDKNDLIHSCKQVESAYIQRNFFSRNHRVKNPCFKSNCRQFPIARRRKFRKLSSRQIYSSHFLMQIYVASSKLRNTNCSHNISASTSKSTRRAYLCFDMFLYTRTPKPRNTSPPLFCRKKTHFSAERQRKYKFEATHLPRNISLG